MALQRDIEAFVLLLRQGTYQSIHQLIVNVQRKTDTVVRVTEDGLHLTAYNPLNMLVNMMEPHNTEKWGLLDVPWSHQEHGDENVPQHLLRTLPHRHLPTSPLPKCVSRSTIASSPLSLGVRLFNGTGRAKSSSLQ